MTAVPPLTDEKLAEIETRIELLLQSGDHRYAAMAYVRDLLSELRRCHARIAAVEALVADELRNYGDAGAIFVGDVSAALAGGGEGNE